MAFGYRWEYDYLYDAFSALVHARGVRHDVSFGDGTMIVRHPFDDAWFSTIAFYVVGWHTMLLMTAAKWHVPDMMSQLQELHRRHSAAVSPLEPREPPPLLS